jgi:hypothetical protein
VTQTHFLNKTSTSAEQILRQCFFPRKPKTSEQTLVSALNVKHPHESIKSLNQKPARKKIFTIIRETLRKEAKEQSKLQREQRKREQSILQRKQRREQTNQLIRQNNLSRNSRKQKQNLTTFCAPIFADERTKIRHSTQGMDFKAVRKEISEELKQAELRSVHKFKLMQKKSKMLNVKNDMLMKREIIRKFMKEKTVRPSTAASTPALKVKRPQRKSVDLTRKYTALRQDITPSRIFEKSESSLPHRKSYLQTLQDSRLGSIDT